MPTFVKLILKTFLVSSTAFLTLIICFVLCFVILGAIGIALTQSKSDKEADRYTYAYGNKDSKNKFLSLKISGVIMGDASSGSPLDYFSDSGITSGYAIKDAFYNAAKEPTIKGIILEINSPGGTIYGAHAVSDGISYYRSKTHKPVIAFISGLAASGGYWSAVSSDYIVADWGSTTGSIGVISGPFKFYDKVVSEDGGAFNGGVVTQNGISSTYITAGKSKDLGNPYRKMTDDEIRILQQGVNNEYDSFVSEVSKYRNISADTIKNDIGALVYDNKTAQDLKLIDTTASKEDAYSILAKRAKINEDSYQIVTEQPKNNGLLSQLLNSYTKSNITKQVQTCGLTRGILAYYGEMALLCSNQ